MRTGGRHTGRLSAVSRPVGLVVAIVTQIEPAQALLQQRRGALLVDVREANETALGHALHALLVPRAQLQKSLQDWQIAPDAALLLMCQSGVRSQAAAAELLAAGFTQVSSVNGGFNRWRAENLPQQQSNDLSDAQRARYSRQLLLPEFGAAGQMRLAQAKVLLIGAGGLGSPAALYLAAAGVGTLAIADGDTVELSNLHRQILHRTEAVGVAKTASASKTLGALNPTVNVLPLPAISVDNVDALIPQFDLVLDGSDNFPTRFLIADACVKHKKPLIYGAVLRFDGQVSVFLGSADPSGAAPCYRCLFPAPPPPESAPSCAEAGVLGVLPGVIGTLQATEAIKLLTGIGTSLSGRLLLFDAKHMRFREIRVPRDPNCPSCKDGTVIQYQETGGYCAA
jgi:sulfur-carrier protein adenylyltransferase/sulfurtransferase